MLRGIIEVSESRNGIDVMFTPPVDGGAIPASIGARVCAASLGAEPGTIEGIEVIANHQILQ